MMNNMFQLGDRVRNNPEFTEWDLVSFAEFCLERSRLSNGDMKHLVYDADLMNWMELKKKDLFIQKMRMIKIEEILKEK